MQIDKKLSTLLSDEHCKLKKMKPVTINSNKIKHFMHNII